MLLRLPSLPGPPFTRPSLTPPDPSRATASVWAHVITSLLITSLFAVSSVRWTPQPGSVLGRGQPILPSLCYPSCHVLRPSFSFPISCLALNHNSSRKSPVYHQQHFLVQYLAFSQLLLTEHTRVVTLRTHRELLPSQNTPVSCLQPSGPPWQEADHTDEETRPRLSAYHQLLSGRISLQAKLFELPGTLASMKHKDTATWPV